MFERRLVPNSVLVTCLLAAACEAPPTPGVEYADDAPPAASGSADKADHAGLAISVGETPHVRIPDADPQGATRWLEVTQPGVARRFNIDISHPYRGDLSVTLISPNGTAVVVHDRTGGGATDLHLDGALDDRFASESALGMWTLRVVDTAAQGEGTLLSWGLDLAASAGNLDPVAPVYPVEPAVPTAPVETSTWRDQWLGGSAGPVVESDHPYVPFRGGRWVVSAPGAQQIRVYFSEFDLRPGDEVRVGPYTYFGSRGAFWSDPVDGDEVTVELIAQRSLWDRYYHGFRIDGLSALVSAR